MVSLQQGRVMELTGDSEVNIFEAPGQVNDLALSADGRYLVTANSNGTAYVVRLSDSAKATSN